MIRQPNATTRSLFETERRLHEPDYVEAQGLLIPATDYLKRAVDAAIAQVRLTEPLLSTVCAISIHTRNR